MTLVNMKLMLSLILSRAIPDFAHVPQPKSVLVFLVSSSGAVEILHVHFYLVSCQISISVRLQNPVMLLFFVRNRIQPLTS